MHFIILYKEKIHWANLNVRLKCNAKLLFSCPSAKMMLLFHHLQDQTATQTQKWYQPAERWRLTSARSATAPTRRGRGRLNARLPAVRMTASKARTQHSNRGKTSTRTCSMSAFTRSTGYQDGTVALELFKLWSLLYYKTKLFWTFVIFTEYLFNFVLNYLWIYKKT